MLVPRYIHGRDSDEVLQAERAGAGHVLLVGPRGTGKTTIARKAFPPEDILFMQVTGALYPESLTVTHLPSEKGFSSVKGILLRAVLYGKVLILDEINAASEDALTPLREAMSGATDRSVTIENCHPEMIDELRTAMETRDLSSRLETVETTVTVHAAPGFMVIGCLNENVFGKRATGLAAPLRDRFSLRVHVHLNRELVVGSGVNTVGVGLWAWGQRNPETWQPSLRELLNFTRHYETVGAEFAASNLLGRIPAEARPLAGAELAKLTGIAENDVCRLEIDDGPDSKAA